MLKSVQVLLHSSEDLRTGEVVKELKRVESLLKDDRMWSTDVEEINQFKALEKQRDKLLRIEETMRRQRSRAVQLKDGEKNTMFFHNKEDQRQRTYTIKRLKGSDGRWRRGHGNSERILLKYFLDIFAFL